MNKTGDIFTILADKYNLHRTVVIEICAHPFRFASRRIADPNDEKAVMMPRFGKFRLKNRYKGRKGEATAEIERKKNEKWAAKRAISEDRDIEIKETTDGDIGRA